MKIYFVRMWIEFYSILPHSHDLLFFINGGIEGRGEILKGGEEETFLFERFL